MNEIKILISFSFICIILSLAGAFYLWDMNIDFIQKQPEPNQRNINTKSKLLESSDVKALRAIAINHYDSINETIERNIEMTKDFTKH